ncbi:aldolase/citrate lyase family protein [Nitrospira sp. M1]
MTKDLEDSIISSGSEPEPLILTFWTGDLALARFADSAGVDRVGVDLEVIGKAERQGGLNTWISGHKEDLIPAMREQLAHAKLFARTNPLHSGTVDEVGRLIDMGVEVLMLPYFTTAQDVRTYAHIVGDRAHVVPLLENVQAANIIEDLVALDEIREIHVGINDLGLSLGFRNRFSTLATDLVVHIASCVRQSGKRLGFGHVGRAMDRSLPIPSDLVYAQYARLGATATIVSRKFVYDAGMEEQEFIAEIQKVRERMAFWQGSRLEDLDNAYEAYRTLLQSLTGQDPALTPLPR